jgi:hypothetical protein
MRREPPAAVRAPVAYCRVSSSAHKPDLKNQRRVVEDFRATRGVANVEYVEEVGGGLNLKRPKFVALMDRIEARQVSHLIAHKDRLVRFGFSWFERVLRKTRMRVVGAEPGTTLARAGDGAGPDDHRALLFCAPVWLAQLPQEARGSAEIGFEMILAHKIALDPKPAHTAYFGRACGTKRYAYNWGLAEWPRMREVGEKPSMAIVKRRWNAHRKPNCRGLTASPSAPAARLSWTSAPHSPISSGTVRSRRSNGISTIHVSKRSPTTRVFELWVDQFDLTQDAVRIPQDRLGQDVRECSNLRRHHGRHRIVRGRTMVRLCTG